MTYPLHLLAVDDAELAQSISTGDVAIAALIFVASIVVAVALRRLLVRVVDREADSHLGRIVGRFLSVVVVAFGAIFAFDVVGVAIGPLVGALGVGGIALAFAAQDILANLVSGVLLQVRHPFRIGDQIRSGEYEGIVDDINLRTVELTTYDGLTAYLPNAEVLRNPIINFTRTPFSRTEIDVGVAYDTDLENAREVLLEACRRADGVQDVPPPEAWVREFGQSSINIAVRYWHAADIASTWRVRSAVAIAVKQSLDGAGMTIPFPQRTLWFGPGSTTLHVDDASER